MYNTSKPAIVDQINTVGHGNSSIVIIALNRMQRVMIFQQVIFTDTGSTTYVFSSTDSDLLESIKLNT